MKRILFVFGVVGFVTLANAQTSAPEKLTMTTQRVVEDAAKQTMHMTAVEIVLAGGTIKVNADDALVNRQTGVFELSGNVRLTVPAPMLAR